MTNAAKDSGDASRDEMRFGFGANWADYVDKKFSDERVEISRRHLLDFLKLSDLKGKTFLDIGCGSGLHSLAAWRSGAAQIVSFDYDRNSVATTRKLHELSGSPENWKIMQGSVLDRDFMLSLPKSDIVYSWGVLHHTGSMWEAVSNAALCLNENSVFYIALYSKDVYVSPPYEYWLDVKRAYNRASAAKRLWMEWRYAWNDSIRLRLLRGENPLSYMKAYKNSRGMSYWHDVRDWLGGYPMEFAGNKETENFGREKLQLRLIHIKAGEGNTEFLFQPSNATTYFDQLLARVPQIKIAGPFTHLRGHAWSGALAEPSFGASEKLMLYENATPIGWPNSPRSEIETWGGGRYRVEDRKLIFSSSDNFDPNRSDRSYAYRPDFA